MRVLITRPEREATTLATALAQRGHVPVIAPLFRLEILHPPATFATDLSECQAILLSSANGARALAEASEQRGKPILAVGDTTASTAEGLGFVSVVSAAGDGRALADLARKRLDPKAGPLQHVSGVDIAQDFAAALAPDGFEVRRVALYEARREFPLGGLHGGIGHRGRILANLLQIERRCRRHRGGSLALPQCPDLGRPVGQADQGAGEYQAGGHQAGDEGADHTQAAANLYGPG